MDLHAWHDCDVRVRPGKPRVLPHGQWHSAEPTCKRVGEIVKYEGLINEKRDTGATWVLLDSHFFLSEKVLVSVAAG